MTVRSRRLRAATGRFVLRVPPGVHGALREAARAAGTSLNEHCLRKLVAPATGLGAAEGATAAVLHAASIFGDDLVAVAGFGSWARGELSDGSDVDLLIVVEDRVALTRELYRRWDGAAALRWGGRPVDAHVVHLPPAERTGAGVWGEVAIDGIVLFERDARLSLRLIQVRRDIAAGRIVRRVAHGQPYWSDLTGDGIR
jgi:predicted nucleotidyltransferase